MLSKKGFPGYKNIRGINGVGIMDNSKRQVLGGKIFFSVTKYSFSVSGIN